MKFRLSLDGPIVRAVAAKSFLLILLLIKNQLVRSAFSRFVWTDTRDGTADVHTKGSISREALGALLHRGMTIAHTRSALQAQAQQPFKASG